MVGWRRFKLTNDLAPSFTTVIYERNDISQYNKTTIAAKASLSEDCKLRLQVMLQTEA